MIKRFAWVGGLVLWLSFPSFAQGWQGWQAGAGLGFGQARGAMQSGSVFVSPGYSVPGGTFFQDVTVAQLDAIGEVAQRKRSSSAGIALAWNTLNGDAVLGWMLDVAQMPLRLRSAASQNYLAPCCTLDGFTVTQSMDTSSLVAFRARFGLGRGDWLWYGSAGMALTDLRVHSQYRETSEAAQASVLYSRWRPGLALGVGVEQRVSADWSWRLEWLWADFGKLRRQANNLSSPLAAFPNSPWITQARLRADRLSVSLQRHW